MHWINESNVYVRLMVRPAVDAEEAVVDALRVDLVSSFSGDAESLILFGSYAYGDQSDESDVDVFALAADDRLKQQLEEKALRESRRFLETYGSHLSMLVLTRAEAAGSLRIGQSGFRVELESTGIILSGSSPGEWGIDGSQEPNPRGVTG